MATLDYTALEGILAFGPGGFLPLKNVKVAQTGSALKPGTVLYTKADGNYAAYTDGVGAASAILISDLPAATGVVRAAVLDGKAPVVRGQLIGLTATAESALRARGIKVIGRTDLPYLPSEPVEPEVPSEVPANAITLGGEPVTLGGEYITLGV